MSEPNPPAPSDRADLTHADVSRLEDIVDRTGLAEVCRSFFDLFSLPLRVFSRDGTLLANVHETREICHYVNELSEGRRLCSKLVTEVKNLEPEREAVDHPCFTGAIYRIVPIDYHGRRLGRFVIGPFLPAETREVPRSLLVLDDSVDANRAREALSEMPRVRKETADRIAEHLAHILDLIIFSGHKSFLTSEMHVASVRESYRSLEEKNSELQTAYDRLKELDRLKSNFLATVSHELRTPLTSIIGYSDMLATGIAGELEAEQLEFVETIRDKGDHLLALISSLLDLGKLEQGQLQVDPEPTDISTLLREAEKTFTPQAAKRSVTLSLSVEDGLPLVPADPMRLRQVLNNLTENALKFSPSGSTITLSARIVEDAPAGDEADMGLVLLATPTSSVEISVADEGEGIAERERTRIFDAFYQIDGSSTREHGGTGLGLSIVQRLVVAHGGRVWVDSAPGRGATFRFTLPLGE